MKKKVFLIVAMVAMLVCIFAISVSAETVIPEWTETQTIPEITVKEGFDTTSRVLLSNGDGTYSTYPTNYIIDGSDTKFSVSTELDFTALKEATGIAYDYASVIRLEIPEGYVTFEDRALRSDRGFTSMLTCKVPEGVTTFGGYMFWKNCVILEVELPNSLTSLGTECFRESTSLKKVSIGSGTIITEMAFYVNTALETVTLAEGITTIGVRAFHTTSSLTQITIPSTVTSIGDYAFYKSGLTDVIIPENVITMGQGIFEQCTSLKSAVIRSGVLGVSAFANCSNLSKVSITADLKSIGSNAFNGVSSTLLTIYTGSDGSALGSLYANERFTKADQITYEQYLLDVANGVTYTKATIVYGANECYALYNNVHKYDYPDYCIAKCERCGLAKNPSVSDHKIETTYSYAKGFNNTGAKITGCVNEGCANNVTEEAPALFTCLGYSTRADGKGGLTAGYQIHKEALDEYLALNPTLTIGLIIVNADTVVNGEILNSDGALTGKGVKIENISTKYSVVNISIDSFNMENAKNLNLAMALYVKDENGYQYMQAEKDLSYYKTRTFGDVELEVVTLYNVAKKNGVETLTLSDGSIAIS